MSAPPIVIAGAGPAGLTLGRCLLAKGIRAVILDRASSSSRRHDYSMDLHRWAYRPLLGILDLEETEFQRKLSASPLRPGTADSYFRCHRGRLEFLLREGLDVKWSHTISGVSSNSEGLTLKLEDMPSIEAPTLIAADGVHSPSRKSLVPDISATIHPYVVFYGTRHISRDQYESKVDSLDASIIESRQDDVLLRIFINNSTADDIALGYTYSRPAHQNDALHNPDRPTAGAKEIPKAFYVELDSLKNLPPIFKDVFDSSKVRQDRLLHWLMRSLLPSRDQVNFLAGQGVLLIGDAVHSMPILGSEGGNMAIREAIELAEWIATYGTADLGNFVGSKYGEWKEGVEHGVKALEEMHGGKRALL